MPATIEALTVSAAARVRSTRGWSRRAGRPSRPPALHLRDGRDDQVAVHVVAVLRRNEAHDLESVARPAMDAMPGTPLGFAGGEDAEVFAVLVDEPESKYVRLSVPGADGSLTLPSGSG